MHVSWIRGSVADSAFRPRRKFSVIPPPKITLSRFDFDTVTLNQQPLKIEMCLWSLVQQVEMIVKYSSALILRNVHRTETPDTL